MASSSIVLHHGLRNTRIHRASIPVSVPSVASPLTLSTLIISASSTPQLSTQTSSTSSKAYSASSSSTPLVKPLSSFDPAPSDKIHPTIPLLTADIQSTPLPDTFLPPSETSELSSTDTKTGSITPKSILKSAASPQASATPTEETHSSSASSSAATGVGVPEHSSATDQSKNTLIRVLVGSIFGVLAFIVMVSLICILLLRSRRRIYGDRKSVSSNGKLSRIDRNSAPTLTSLSPRYLSELPFHSDTPSPPSRSSHVHSTSGPLTTPKPVLFQNPFSKAAELCAGLPYDSRGIRNVENPFADPAPVNDRPVPRYGPSKPSLIGLQPIPQEKTGGLVIPRSMYGSDHSLGSTIVLPGRNSSVGSFQVISYRISHPSETTSPRPVEPAWRKASTRSDPFDLEVPADAVHPRR